MKIIHNKWWKLYLILGLFAIICFYPAWNCADYSLTTKSGSSGSKKPIPDEPSNLIATAVSETQVNLVWTDKSKVEDGFKIESREGGTGAYTQIATVNADITSYSDTGVIDGSTYYYRVCAYNKRGDSDYSNAVSSLVALNTPTSLSLTVVSSAQNNLSWTDNSNHESGFKIERKTGAGGTYEQINSTNADIVSYYDTDLIGSTNYYYRICAYNTRGVSDYSNEVFIITNPPIVISPIPNNGAISVSVTAQLSWAAANGATSYDVYFCTTGTPAYQANIAGLNYNPGVLDYNTVYYWRIDSQNTIGITTGNVWIFTTQQPPLDQATSPIPANGATYIITTTHLSWAAATGATLYDVYFGTGNPPAFQTNTTALSYDPGTLLSNTIYYWRIDSRSEERVTTGNLWSFTTRDDGSFQFPCEVTDVVFDTLRPYLYVTDKANRKVFFLNLATGFIEKEFTFSYMPESICIRPDGSMLYVSLLTREHDSCWWDEDGHIGYIAEFDLTTQSKTKEFVIDEDPYDIVATDNGDIIVASGSGQWSYIKRYRTFDGVKIGTSNIRAMSHIKLHANQQWVYAVDTDTSSEAIEKYFINGDGSMTHSSMSSYPDFPQGTGTNIFLNPSGDVLVTKGGSICHTTNDSSDRTYIQGLFASYSNIPDIAFDNVNKVIFALQGNNLYVFNSVTYEQIGPFIPLGVAGSFIGVKENYVYVLRKQSGKTFIVRIEHPVPNGNANTPPTANFTIAPESGDTGTNFLFDATGCTDTQDSLNNLVVKWDWNNDGAWDTTYSTTKIISHSYAIAGTKTIRMRVRDMLGLTNDKVISLNVALRAGETQPAYELQFNVADEVFDPVRPYLYVTNQTNKKVYFVNLNTGFIEKEFSFTYTPGSICTRPDGSMLYVALVNGNTGYIAEFDLTTQSKTKEFAVEQDPYDIVATDNGDIIVASGSGQWSYIKRYRASDGVRIGTSDIRAMSHIKLHANQQWVYAVDTDTSSEAIQKYFINGDGSMTHSSMSSYPDFPQGTGENIFLSPLGNILITQGSSVCTTTGDSTDRTYIQGLFASYASISDITFDTIKNAIFVVQANKLYCFNSITYGQIGTFIPLSSNGSFVGLKENYIYVLRIGSGNTLIDKIVHPIP